MKKAILGLALSFCVVASLWADSPFKVSAVRQDEQVSISLSIPEHHILYEDMLTVANAEGQTLTAIKSPKSKIKKDQFTGEERAVYDHDVSGVWDLNGSRQIVVNYQGCDATTCFFPETKTFSFETVEPASESTLSDDHSAMGLSVLDLFEPPISSSGYQKAKDFTAFLQQARSGEAVQDATGKLLSQGWLMAGLLILLGGLLLNLTPCVLPLIPINLAIIGAGAQARSKKDGALLGFAYGLGMALVYGLLGLIVILTGSKFGSFTSSPWFNLFFAILFVLLSLAMFDVFQIDLSRFQTRLGDTNALKAKGKYAFPLLLGGIAALLAGACVAPVLITVLLLASRMYGEGYLWALLLPFLLGAGMGLPWPIAGAGMSVLPKPGAWMNHVKHAFGVFILLMAAYYGYQAWTLAGWGTAETHVAAESSSALALIPTQDHAEFVQALESAHAQQRPVLIDFWASWCKSCHAMEKTTFTHPDVKTELEQFVFIKYQSEKPGQQPARDVLDPLGVLGLPTYVVLLPKPLDAK